MRLLSQYLTQTVEIKNNYYLKRDFMIYEHKVGSLLSFFSRSRRPMTFNNNFLLISSKKFICQVLEVFLIFLLRKHSYISVIFYVDILRTDYILCKVVSRFLHFDFRAKAQIKTSVANLSKQIVPSRIYASLPCLRHSSLPFCQGKIIMVRLELEVKRPLSCLCEYCMQLLPLSCSVEKQVVISRAINPTFTLNLKYTLVRA